MSVTPLPNALRADFKEALELRMRPTAEMLADTAFAELVDDKKLNLDKLDEASSRELRKLQKSAEDFEAHFVKGMLAKMRAVRFGEEDSPMTQMAKDMMDESVATSLASGPSGLGIGKTLFTSMGEQIVLQAAGRKVSASTTSTLTTKGNE